MSRLAARSPAAPFSTSRPAPMPQYPPQATTTTEAQTLRKMVQQREATIESRKHERMVAHREHTEPQHTVVTEHYDGIAHSRIVS